MGVNVCCYSAQAVAHCHQQPRRTNAVCTALFQGAIWEFCLAAHLPGLMGRCGMPSRVSRGPGAAPYRQATNFFSFRIHMGRIQLGPRGRVLPNETCALFTRKGERPALRGAEIGKGRCWEEGPHGLQPRPPWCAHVYAHRRPASHGSSSGKDMTGGDTTLE